MEKARAAAVTRLPRRPGRQRRLSVTLHARTGTSPSPSVQDRRWRTLLRATARHPWSTADGCPRGSVVRREH